MLVRHYSAMGYGVAKLRDELYRRGVPKELWDDALEQMPDVETVIEKVIAQKTKGAALNEKERRKLFEALLRRGFSRQDIKNALGRLGETIEEEQE